MKTKYALDFIGSPFYIKTKRGRYGIVTSVEIGKEAVWRYTYHNGIRLVYSTVKKNQFKEITQKEFDTYQKKKGNTSFIY